MKTSILPLFALLVACGPSTSPVDGGQSGTVVPAMCVEVSRSTVMDFEAIPEGFSQSLAQTLLNVEGEWLGELMSDGASLGPIEVSVFPASDVGTAIIYEMQGDDAPSEPGDPLPGAVDVDCGPTFALVLQVELSAGELLAESTLVEAEFTASGASAIVGRIPLENVVGTATPDFDPADYAETALQFDVSAGMTGRRIDLQWAGSPLEASGSDEVNPGVVSPFGWAELQPAPVQ